jgi:prevent-host-death family protein|uniref:Antitoxin n=1 Tax=Gracilinema caldarium TaxID=215591 RepID=A0A7C3IIS2_9SPIR
MTISISEAKAHLSSLIDRAFHGERIVISKNNLPIADLVPHKPEGSRRLGLLKGKMMVPEDIMEEDEDINEMFYGETR